MKNQDTLILSKTDFENLSALTNLAKKELAELLEEELGRASLVADDRLPADVVSMNSTVSFEDLESGKTSTVTLVYPPEANIEAGKISVLTPVGSALIGLRVGQVIRWPFPNGKKKELKVLSVSRS